MDAGAEGGETDMCELVLITVAGCDVTLRNIVVDARDGAGRDRWNWRWSECRVVVIVKMPAIVPSPMRHRANPAEARPMGLT